MDLSKLNERKLDLQGGLERLETNVKQYLKAIEIQKGAIGEVDHWINEVVKENKETVERPTEY
jgi:hypothetical protein